ncbi:hypothetical protein CEUSTIGMA_g7020.t1 [Chlamydomonas eustigma]|uniref:Rad21/Rec8-like protein N-terminal domain-containing protein n=1 Tax=Chlamydomonas eustigma TaxID=1157962 RepID=A0A250X9L6_9CHLO|nr:hypothetical protein CEUSTIGMA_g7020.t1 [Chlamydomonas eustigma]|eukprot:GAX79579.1 hypothetical protein CEUSTIGMA_g7020.t1 [Chlamydomonas eustigma]
MFYSIQILSKGGPLQVIWMAAHMDRQLKRHQIVDTSITATVDTIIQPHQATAQGATDEPPIALRLSGQLMLGVVKVYAQKMAYLQQDCDEALLKIGTVVDDSAPAEKTATFTKPETGKGLTVDPSQKDVQCPSRQGGERAGEPTPGREMYEDNILAEYCPVSEEDVFGTYNKANTKDATASGQLLTPGNFPLSQSGSATASKGDPLTPPFTYFGGLGTEPPPLLQSHLAGRPRDLFSSLNTPAALMTPPLGDDDVFEVVPDYFDFDLDDMEVAALTAVHPLSQQLSSGKEQAPATEIAAAPVASSESQQLEAVVGGAWQEQQEEAYLELLSVIPSYEEDELDFNVHDEGFGRGMEGDDEGCRSGSQTLVSPEATMLARCGEACSDEDRYAEREGLPSDTSFGGLPEISAMLAESHNKTENPSAAAAIIPSVLHSEALNNSEQQQLLHQQQRTEITDHVMQAEAVGWSMGSTSVQPPHEGTRVQPPHELVLESLPSISFNIDGDPGLTPHPAKATLSSEQNSVAIARAGTASKLGHGRVKAVVDESVTMINNAVYRTYMSDRSDLLKPKLLINSPLRAVPDKASVVVEAAAAGHLLSPTCFTAGTWQLLSSIPLHAHEDLRSLYRFAVTGSAAGSTLGKTFKIKKSMDEEVEVNLTGDALSDPPSAQNASGRIKRRNNGKAATIHCEDKAPGSKDLSTPSSSTPANEDRNFQPEVHRRQDQDSASDLTHQIPENVDMASLNIDADGINHTEEQQDEEQQDEEQDEASLVSARRGGQGVLESRELDVVPGIRTSLGEDKEGSEEEEEEEEGEDHKGDALSGYTHRTRLLLHKLNGLFSAFKDDEDVQERDAEVPGREHGRKRKREAGLGSSMSEEGGEAGRDELGNAAGLKNNKPRISMMQSLLCTQPGEIHDPQGKGDAQKVGSKQKMNLRSSKGTDTDAVLQLRRKAAHTFYDLLVLQNRGVIKLVQEHDYADVLVENTKLTCLPPIS